MVDDVEGAAAITPLLRSATEEVARRLEAKSLRGAGLRIKLKTARFQIVTRQGRLPYPTADIEVLFQVATRLLAQLALAEPVRLVGVGVANLEPIAETQLGLFGAPKQAQRRAKLNQALDQIADRFGGAAVKRGGQGDAERAALSMQIKRGEAED